MLGLMTKITDDDVGKVYVNDVIHKPVTESDREKLCKGIKISREILVQDAATMDIIFLLLSCPLKFKEGGNYEYYERCQHCY